MSAKIYVGNLSWNTNDDTLRQAFASYGNIVDSIVMRDRETSRSRGFGFVTYSNEAEAHSAINGMNDQELDGRRIRVNIANARSGGGGSSGGYQSSYSSGGGGYGSGNSGYGAQSGYQASGNVGQTGYQAPSGYGYPQQGASQLCTSNDQALNVLQVSLKEAISKEVTSKGAISRRAFRKAEPAMAINSQTAVHSRATLTRCSLMLFLSSLVSFFHSFVKPVEVLPSPPLLPDALIHTSPYYSLSFPHLPSRSQTTCRFRPWLAPSLGYIHNPTCTTTTTSP
ncbi:hypothetical protein BC827DRAFT_710584 [Russula dissimulans]|nr:hypothetical protein BC827DRAFT_710584 [Russula dissimulans]